MLFSRILGGSNIVLFSEENIKRFLQKPWIHLLSSFPISKEAVSPLRQVIVIFKLGLACWKLLFFLMLRTSQVQRPQFKDLCGLP